MLILSRSSPEPLTQADRCLNGTRTSFTANGLLLQRCGRPERAQFSSSAILAQCHGANMAADSRWQPPIFGGDVVGEICTTLSQLHILCRTLREVSGWRKQKKTERNINSKLETGVDENQAGG